MRSSAITYALLGLVCLSFSQAQAAPVQELISPGGIKAWLVEEHSQPLLAINIVFRDSGAAQDPEGKEGRASITAAMLLEGAGDMDSNEFNAALEEKAIRLNTSIDEDLFRLSLVTLSEHKASAFSYMAMAITQPRFDDSALERVREQSLTLLKQQEKEPGYLLTRRWEQLVFQGHPYSSPALGNADSVGGLTADDLHLFAKRYLTRENMIVAVAGDITPEELKQLLDTHLKALPTQYLPEKTVPDITIPTKSQRIVLESDIPQTMVIFGMNGLKRSDPQFLTGYVMNYMVGGGSFTSKLVNELREQRGLVYSVSSQLNPMLHSGLWMGGFATRNEKAGEAVQTLRATLAHFSESGPTDAELLDAKQYITGSFVLGLDSNADIANYLVTMQLHGLGIDYLDKRNSFIQAVRKEDVQRLAKQLLNPDALLVVMVGKPVLDNEP